MNKIESLINSYRNFFNIPWIDNAADADRVIFCIYNKEDERQIRFRLDEFKAITMEAGNHWCPFDLSDTFAQWIVTEKYGEKYFNKPELVSSISQYFLDFLVKQFDCLLNNNNNNDWEKSVVAIFGTASLFGFLKVNEVVEKISSCVPGRLLVFFPGSCENNNYRLLDAYDGWNYHAKTITGNEEFI